MENDAKYAGRSWAWRLLIIVLGLSFTARLFYLQFIDTDYKIFAENNTIRREIITPPRGFIFDRKGRTMVSNETIYDVMMVPSKLQPFDTAQLCRILQIDTLSVRIAIENATLISPHLPSPLVKKLSRDQLDKFKERLFSFRGFYIQPQSSRTYPSTSAAHIIGYLGETSQKEIDTSKGYYSLGDYIGTSGIERQYESVLRGTKGERKILVDALNREQGRYKNGEEDVAPEAGNDIYTSIDLDLQRYIERLMKGKRGSVVALEPSTGEVLAMVSAPDFDLNELQGRDRGKVYRKLLIDPAKPLFNRAIGAAYPPGSTLKPVEAIMGLTHGVVEPSNVVSCHGGFRLSSAHTIGCHSPGAFDMFGSIKMSCNTYYCQLFKWLVDNPKMGSVANGINTWADDLRKFGLGTKLGIDIPNERRGILPSSAMYDRAYGKGRWNSTTIISLGIGQAEIGVTPLQLANEAAIIANRGHYITPHFVTKFGQKEKTSSTTWARHEVVSDTATMNFMAGAMQAVVDRGTAYFAKIPWIRFAGKTGTAENPHGDDHSLFIAFAPKDNPKIALAIVIENAGYGGTWAAPMGSLIVERYLTDTCKRKEWESWIFSNLYIKKQEKKRLEQQRKKDSADAARKSAFFIQPSHEPTSPLASCTVPTSESRLVFIKSYALLPEQRRNRIAYSIRG